MIIQIRNFFIDCKPNHNPENNPEWNLCLHKGKSDTQYYRKKEHIPFNTPTQYCDRGSYRYSRHSPKHSLYNQYGSE